MGYETEVHRVNSNVYKLKTYGEYNYDHLVLLCTDSTGNLIKCLIVISIFRKKVFKKCSSLRILW